MGNPSSDRTIAVYGAAGHTGRFVVRELSRRGLTPIAVGRSEQALAASGFPSDVVVRTAALDDPEALAAALSGAAAVINCAGPFLDTADQLVAAALAAGIHYIDVTPEQESARTTFARWAEPAATAGVVVLPAMGFYGGLADLLVARAMGDWARADEVRVGIALDSWKPTIGTRLTGRRNTFARVVIADGKLSPLRTPSPSTSWTFTGAFGVQDVVEMPFTETVLVQSRGKVDVLHTYLNTAPLVDLRDPATPPPVPADASGRSAQTFVVEVEARLGTDVRSARASGRDIYAVTAPLVVEAVERLLGRGSGAGGVFAPAALFDATDFLVAAGLDLQEV